MGGGSDYFYTWGPRKRSTLDSARVSTTIKGRDNGTCFILGIGKWVIFTHFTSMKMVYKFCVPDILVDFSLHLRVYICYVICTVVFYELSTVVYSHQN